MPNMFVHITVFLDNKLGGAITMFFFVIRLLALFDIVLVICEMKVRILIANNIR